MNLKSKVCLYKNKILYQYRIIFENWTFFVAVLFACFSGKLNFENRFSKS